MEQFPYPQSPTEQEVIVENKILRQLLFLTPPLILAALLVVGLLIAICIAVNFNPMSWLE